MEIYKNTPFLQNMKLKNHAFCSNVSLKNLETLQYINKLIISINNDIDIGLLINNGYTTSMYTHVCVCLCVCMCLLCLYVAWCVVLGMCVCVGACVCVCVAFIIRCVIWF